MVPEIVARYHLDTILPEIITPDLALDLVSVHRAEIMFPKIVALDRPKMMILGIIAPDLTPKLTPDLAPNLAPDRAPDLARVHRLEVMMTDIIAPDLTGPGID